MATIIAYTFTLVAVVLAATSLLQAVVGGILGRLMGPLIGAVIGGLASWALVDLLWVWLEGDHVPIAALVGALIVLVTQSAISRHELTQQSNWMMAGEAWGIVLLGIYLVTVPEAIRWY